ncbi:MAG: Aryl carrier protein [Verrucomicrobiaceae bacterium]|nr:Aryl carrier protein [Verrucomicrobiaceae bacterium]
MHGMVRLAFLMSDPITPAVILDLIVEQQIVESAEPLTATTDLFGEGLDSMAMMQLLLHLEDRFGIEVTPAEMTRDRFQTAAALAAFLAEKTGGK